MTEEKAKELVLCLSKDEIACTRAALDVDFAYAASRVFIGTKSYEMLPRGEAETSTTHVQVIPYCVVKRGDKILAYVRTKSGGESRLHEKISIGVGGHINPEDVLEDSDEPDFACVRRELMEELKFSSDDPKGANGTMNNICWFYDDSNEVSKVHVCTLFLLDLPETVNIEPNETSVADLRWYTLEELYDGEVFDKLESWSQETVYILRAIAAADEAHPDTPENSESATTTPEEGAPEE